MTIFDNRPLSISIYSLETGVPNIASINNAESDLLAGAMTERQPMHQHMDGDQNLQTQLQLPQHHQQPQYMAPMNVSSANPTQVIPHASNSTRAAHQHAGANVYTQTSVNQRPEQTDKLTGWTNQPVQYNSNQTVTGNVHPWPPSY